MTTATAVPTTQPAYAAQAMLEWLKTQKIQVKDASAQSVSVNGYVSSATRA
jgi:hypothetical protein